MPSHYDHGCAVSITVVERCNAAAVALCTAVHAVITYCAYTTKLIIVDTRRPVPVCGKSCVDDRLGCVPVYVPEYAHAENS